MDEITIIPDLFLRGNSKNYKNWQSTYLGLTTCKECRGKHGKIYDFDEDSYQPEHERCRCMIIPMRTKQVGIATEKGFNGADAWLMYQGKLPDYYVTKDVAKQNGYRRQKHNLADVLPGYMIGGNEFLNSSGKLPESFNRRWFEADIDYTYGKRNLKRILFSNDGLIFLT